MRQEAGASLHEKEALRKLIDAQVHEFLARGGRIDVLGDDNREGARIGSVWYGHDDIAKLTADRR